MDYKQMICGTYCDNKRNGKGNFLCENCGDLLKNCKVSEEAREAIGAKFLVPLKNVYGNYIDGLKEEMLASIEAENNEEVL